MPRFADSPTKYYYFGTSASADGDNRSRPTPGHTNAEPDSSADPTA
jgi:hypothetical protein